MMVGLDLGGECLSPLGQLVMGAEKNETTA